MIKPTVGRVIWFYPSIHDRGLNVYNTGEKQPLQASIAFVWSDECINIGGVDHAGSPYSRTSVPLVQAGCPVPETSYATWMPYQVGQAAKAA